MANQFEQLVADYLTEQGYLCTTNVNYRKAGGKQSGSDIDVLAMRKMPPHDVIVGDCKSWGDGFWGDWMLDSTKSGPARQRQYFKAIFQPEWAEGLANKVDEVLGTRKFVYTIYCTRNKGSVAKLESMLVEGQPIKVVDFVTIIRQTADRIGRKRDSSVEPTTLGRFIQLLAYSGVSLTYP